MKSIQWFKRKISPKKYEQNWDKGVIMSKRTVRDILLEVKKKEYEKPYYEKTHSKTIRSNNVKGDSNNNNSGVSSNFYKSNYDDNSYSCSDSHSTGTTSACD